MIMKIDNMKKYEEIWWFEEIWRNMIIWRNMKKYEEIWRNVKKYEKIWKNMKKYENEKQIWRHKYKKQSIRPTLIKSSLVISPSMRITFEM